MNDYISIVNDENNWYHAYNDDAIVLHSVNGNKIVKCNDDTIMVGFPTKSLDKVVKKLRYENIDYKIDADEVYKNENNNYIINLSKYNTQCMNKVINNIDGQFTIRYNDEPAETYDVDNIRNAEIVKIILTNEVGKQIKVNNEILTIIDKKISFKDADVNEELVEEKHKFIKKLKEQSNLGFIHATSIDNLDSIISTGKLYSRYKCETLNIKFKDNANHEVLKITDDNVKKNVRFYFRPKTPTLCNFYSNDHNICLLVFDYNIIDDYENGTIIDRKPMNKFKKEYKLNSIVDMSKISDEFDYQKVFYKDFVDYYSSIWDYKSAELLINYSVDIKYLKEIIFPSENALNEFKKKHSDYNIKATYNREVF